jgi:hypothetical protein
MACRVRKPTKVDALGRRVEKVDKLRASKKDRAVNDEWEPICELDADYRAAEGSGNITRVSGLDINKRSNTSVRYLKPDVKPSTTVLVFLGGFHCWVSEICLKPTDFDII